MTRLRELAGLALALLCAGGVGEAQIDPTRRELIQFGYSQPLEGNGPLSGYAFYYLNVPHFMRTNLTMRLALAPVYLDSELGISGVLTPHTDLGLGVAGGGFADNYYEVRQGQYRKDESFTGHGVSASSSLYHLFNPGALIPLNGVLRLESHSAFYQRDSATRQDFVLPQDQTVFGLRTGARWGGKEPVLLPDLAMELSGWYEAMLRTAPGLYGLNGDRRIEQISHLFWARGLLVYTLPESKQNFFISLTLGTSLGADRFSAYRLGGVLPLAAEFPLTLPGYYFQEISAKEFALLGVNYSLPLDHRNRWALNALGTTAGVNYIPGLEQPGHWHSGVGGGLRYRSPNDDWQIVVGYAYGIDAIRTHGHGAQAVGILLQFDLDRAHMSFFEPGQYPYHGHGFQRILNGLFN
jgi:hypothetical protein